METTLRILKERLREISDLQSAAALLYWDQSTYMPSGGGEGRARQLAVVSRVAHEKAVAPELADLLDKLTPWAEQQPRDSDDAALVRVARRDVDRARRVPPAFTAEMSAHHSRAYEAWTRARPANDFSAVAPILQRTVALSRELAGFFPGYDHVADPLIAYADEGVTVAELKSVFDDLRKGLRPLVERITVRPAPDDACLQGDFPEEAQLRFAREVIRDMGFDFARGRCDKTPHPFMIRCSGGDVRITTRVRNDFLGEALFSMIHETGHALYEQGVPAEWDGTPLGEGASSGVHESQSRLWENIVGRGLPFWRHYFPRLQAAFPGPLSGVRLDDFHRAVNRVERSLIRTDADEVTYNLHVMIRFDIECALLEGRLLARDLPEAWRAAYQRDLGITPPDDRDGCLQDMHWFSGTVGGMFQGYTLGNLLSAQWFESACRESPDIPDAIARGHLTPLLDWLRRRIHACGRKFMLDELVQRVCGGPLSSGPYLRYLHAKYDELYRL